MCGGQTVRVQVLDFLTHVTICQRYTNTFPSALECKYVFPMDAGAAVNRLVITIDDRVIEGCVMERAAAKDTYTAAMRAGDGAVLLEQSTDSVDVFEASVGNVLPGQTVEVRISYVSEVALAGSDLRFVLPTTVAPRYTASADKKTPAKPEPKAPAKPEKKRIAAPAPTGAPRVIPPRLPTPSDPVPPPPSGLSAAGSPAAATATPASADTLARDDAVSADAAGATAREPCAYLAATALAQPHREFFERTAPWCRCCCRPLPGRPTTAILARGYSFTARVSIATASSITAVTCPSHADSATIRTGRLVPGDNTLNTRAVVTLGVDSGVGLGGDFVILIRQEQPHQHRVWVETLLDDRNAEAVPVRERSKPRHALPASSPESDTLGIGPADGACAPAGAEAVAIAAGSDVAPTSRAIMVSLYPNLRALRWRHDPTLNFVFVVDRSGSMGGWKMESAKRTLQLCLRSLPPGSHFQIVSFGNRFERLFTDGSVEYDDGTLARATAYVEGMASNMGTCTWAHGTCTRRRWNALTLTFGAVGRESHGSGPPLQCC